MLVIRLQRVGKKHQVSYRIVLQDKRWKPAGKVMELFGFYNPHSKEKQIQTERVKFWLEKGAQPSGTLHNMFVDMGIIKGEKVKLWNPKKTEVSAEVKPAEPVSAVESAREEIASNATEVAS